MIYKKPTCDFFSDNVTSTLILLCFVASFIMKENTFSTMLMKIKMLFFFSYSSSQTFFNSMTLRLKKPYWEAASGCPANHWV